jgi:hypothetical protein
VDPRLELEPELRFDWRHFDWRHYLLYFDHFCPKFDSSLFCCRARDQSIAVALVLQSSRPEPVSQQVEAGEAAHCFRRFLNRQSKEMACLKPPGR